MFLKSAAAVYHRLNGWLSYSRQHTAGSRQQAVAGLFRFLATEAQSKVRQTVPSEHLFLFSLVIRASFFKITVIHRKRPLGGRGVNFKKGGQDEKKTEDRSQMQETVLPGF